MAEHIVRTHLDLVDGLYLEANSLKAGLGLLYSVLTFDRSNEAAISEAQDHLYFIAEAMSNAQKRIELLASDASALLKAEKAAA